MTFSRANTYSLDVGIRSLITPHDRLGQSGMGLVAASTVAIGIVVSRFGVRFDGFWSINASPKLGPVPILIAVADQLVPLVVGAALAWLIVRWFAVSPRYDTLLLILGTVRAPLVLASPIAILIHPSNVTSLMPLLMLLAAVAVVWSLALLISGVRFATGLGERRLGGAAFCTLVATELIGSLALTFVTG
jgi:hypothetical protein